MSMHPTLTTAVYVIIAIVFLSVLTYMFLYTRGLKTKRIANQTGSVEAGIAAATEEKERTGRTGTIS